MKLVLYNDSIKNDSSLLNSINTDECVLKYVGDYLDVNNLISSIPSDNQITNLAFLYHYPGNNMLPFYYDPSMLLSRYTFFSNNLVNLFVNLRNRNNGELVVDILTCNMNNEYFSTEVLKIQNELGITIRYSVNLTGNSSNGFDWIMESHNLDIKNYYFNSNINNWNGNLGADLGPSARLNGVSGITYNSTTKVFVLNANINWRADDYITLQSGERFNGNGYTVSIIAGLTVLASECSGMFSVHNTVTSISNAPIIENLIMTGSGLAQFGGYVIRSLQRFFIVRNCITNGPITGIQSGGICGGSNGGGEFSIYNCYNTGVINSVESGGIAARSFARIGGYGTIYNCYNTGPINGTGSGGICGANAAEAGGNCVIYNCYNTGIIAVASGTASGGICGQYAGFAGTVIVMNCYSTSTTGAGICGNGVGSFNGTTPGSCVVAFCYSPTAAPIPSPAIAGVNIVLGGPNTYSVASAISGTIFAHGTALLSTMTLSLLNTSRTYSNGTPLTTPLIFTNTYGTLYRNPTNITFNLTAPTSGNPLAFIANPIVTEYPLLNFTVVAANTVPCFTGDTSILTTEGYINVQQLTINHVAICSDNRQSKINCVSSFSVPKHENTCPYKIQKYSLSEDYPPHDLTLSPNHLLLFNGKWLLPKDIPNSERYNSLDTDMIQLYHVKLENYITDHLVVNGGTIIESFTSNLKSHRKEYNRRIGKIRK